MKILKFLGTVSMLAAFAMAVSLSPAVEQKPEPGPATAGSDAFQRRVQPFVDRYCVDCHSQDYSEGKIVLDRFADQAAAVKDGETWLRVLDALEGRIMPPSDMPQPTLDELEGVIAWIEDDYLAAQLRRRDRLRRRS